MAVVVKLDLLGSTQSHGFTDFNLTRAVQRGIVTGLTNNRNALRQALIAVRTEVGEGHHNIQGLPVASITGVRFGATKALVRVTYAFSTFRAPLPNTAVFSLVNVRLRTDEMEVYRTFTAEDGTFAASVSGLPDGVIHGIDNPALSRPEPRGWMMHRPVLDIFVKTVLRADPTGAIGGHIWKLNSDTVTLGTLTFQPFQLQFAGLDVDWSFEFSSIPGPGVAAGTKYFTLYKFIAAVGGHVTQHTVAPNRINPQDQTITNVWTTYESPMGDSIPFSGAFPVHAGQVPA